MASKPNPRIIGLKRPLRSLSLTDLIYDSEKA